MSQDRRNVRFGLWYDFRNPPQWRQPSDRLYGEILDQIVWGENNGFDDVWLSEHHFIEDGYLPSILPVAAAIAARTKRIRITSGVILMPFHNPVRLEDIAVVDVISGGRLELGVGVGFKAEEFESFGVPFKERGPRIEGAHRMRSWLRAFGRRRLRGGSGKINAEVNGAARSDSRACCRLSSPPAADGKSLTDAFPSRVSASPFRGSRMHIAPAPSTGAAIAGGTRLSG
jgi:hypothetical protein